MLDQHNTNDTVSGCLQATGASSESCTTSEAGAGSPQQLPARPPAPSARPWPQPRTSRQVVRGWGPGVPRALHCGMRWKTKRRRGAIRSDGASTAVCRGRAKYAYYIMYKEEGTSARGERSLESPQTGLKITDNLVLVVSVGAKYSIYFIHLRIFHTLPKTRN